MEALSTCFICQKVQGAIAIPGGLIYRMSWCRPRTCSRVLMGLSLWDS